MYIVYILKSEVVPDRIYIGLTQDLPRRLAEHNRTTTGYTQRYAPWKVETFVTFQNRQVAESFELYLKQGSGFAFLKKRLLPTL